MSNPTKVELARTLMSLRHQLLISGVLTPGHLAPFDALLKRANRLATQETLDEDDDHLTEALLPSVL